MKLIYVLSLSVALGMDALVSGVAYGIKGIRVPPACLGIVGVVTVVCTAVVMGLTRWLSGFVDLRVAIGIGAAMLVALGVYRLLLDFLNRDVVLHERGRHALRHRKLTLTVGELVIRIMLRPEEADIDRSKHISGAEAALLGVALAVDNMVAASAGTLGDLLPVYTPLAMGAVQVALISAGTYGCAWLVDHRVRFRLPYLSGATLVILGLIRLV
jgi:putative sporulation protein YtaF